MKTFSRAPLPFDFDGYTGRLAGVAATNRLLADLAALAEGCPRHKRMPEPLRRVVVGRLAAEDLIGGVDWITVSSSVLFSCNCAASLEDMSTRTLYNNIRGAYDAEGYLGGVEVVKCDYRELLQAEPRAFAILDPPYLSTDTAAYSKDTFWGLTDVSDSLQGRNFAYFTSSKSELVELCGWLGQHTDFSNPFAGAERHALSTSPNGNCKGYEDIMLFGGGNKETIDTI